MRTATIAVGLFLLVAPACSSTRAKSNGSETVRIGVGVGASARGGGLTVLTKFLYSEPLIALASDGQPVGRLAEHWVWENARKTLRITLRHGITLHDGRSLTASVASTFLNAKINALRRDGHRGALDLVTSIDVPDDRTLLLQLSEPDAFLIPELNNAHLVDPDSPDVGTGPFKLLSREPVVDAARFSDYHRGAPALERVRIVPYDSQRAAWAALMRDDVDAVHEVSRDSVEFIEQDSGVQTFLSLRPYFWALSFNLRHPQLRQPHVRQALNQAVNRQEIVATVLRGYATVAVDPIWPLHWAYRRTLDQPGYDPGAARLRLDRAGLPGEGTAQTSPRLKFRCLFFGEDAQLERMALMVQRQFNDIGVDVELQPASYDEIVTRLQAADFDSVLTPMASGRALDWTYRFWHSPRAGEKVIQATGYTGGDLVLDELRRAYSDDEVRDGVAKLRRIFVDEPPAVFIAWQQATRAVSSRFDISAADKHDAFADVWQWKPAVRPK